MNKQEFIKEQCGKLNMNEEIFSEKFTALPCACGKTECKGWARVKNNDIAIKHHMDNFAPKYEGLLH